MTKRCPTCGQEKAMDAFAVDRNSKDGLLRQCKICRAAYKRSYRIQHLSECKARDSAYKREWVKSHPEEIRRSNLLQKHGMTPDQWNDKFIQQGGMCGICGRVTDLCVDHNHRSGKNRGLLCSSCNAALGLLKEDFRSIVRMLEYLCRYEEACDMFGKAKKRPVKANPSATEYEKATAAAEVAKKYPQMRDDDWGKPRKRQTAVGKIKDSAIGHQKALEEALTPEEIARLAGKGKKRK